jgi:hypothetical protein
MSNFTLTPLSEAEAQELLSERAGRVEASPAKQLVDEFLASGAFAALVDPAEFPAKSRGDDKGEPRTASDVASAINTYVRTAIKDGQDVGAWAKRTADGKVMVWARDPAEIRTNLEDPEKPKRGRPKGSGKRASATASEQE